MDGKFGGGDGSLSNPFLIEDYEDLQAINNNLTGCYKLNNNLDLVGIDYVPIASVASLPYFSGSLDGNNKTISNITGSLTKGLGGIFGTINNAIIKNLFIKDINIINSSYKLGGIAGSAEGDNNNINNIKITGKLKGKYGTGGLIGSVESKSIEIENIYIEVQISDFGYNLGGILGVLGTMQNTNLKANLKNIVSNSSFPYISTSSKGYLIGSSYVSPQNIILDNIYVNKDKCKDSGMNYLFDYSENYNLRNQILKIDEEMKKQSTFLGLDFTNIWYMHSITGYSNLLAFQEIVNKILIKDINKYYTIQNNTLVEVVIPSVDQLENTIESNGFENIKDILYVKDKISKFEIKLKQTKI